MLVVWLPLIAMTISILGPLKTLAWHLLVVPAHAALLLARRKLPDWGSMLVFAIWWGVTVVFLWNWDPLEARYGAIGAFFTACVVSMVGQTNREGVSARVEKLAGERPSSRHLSTHPGAVSQPSARHSKAPLG
jgi:hypothetical protein